MGQELTNFLLSALGQINYVSIFILMATESSILPVPSELVMIPAGYLAASGKLDLGLVLLAGGAGSVVGSVASYYLAWELGRPLLARWGRYVYVTEKHLDQAELFFERHGPISIFSGRFVPVIRHLISLPAGLAQMPLGKFSLYTLLGAGIWNAVLAALGYFLGGNKAWLQGHWFEVVLGAIAFAIITVAIYMYSHRDRDSTIAKQLKGASRLARNKRS